MPATIAPERSATRHPRQTLAVWVFCIATVSFWMAAIHYLTGLSIAGAVLATGLLSLATLPVAGRLAQIIWEQPD